MKRLLFNLFPAPACAAACRFAALRRPPAQGSQSKQDGMGASRYEFCAHKKAIATVSMLPHFGQLMSISDISSGASLSAIPSAARASDRAIPYEISLLPWTAIAISASSSGVAAFVILPSIAYFVASSTVSMDFDQLSSAAVLPRLYDLRMSHIGV